MAKYKIGQYIQEASSNRNDSFNSSITFNTQVCRVALDGNYEECLKITEKNSLNLYNSNYYYVKCSIKKMRTPQTFKIKLFNTSDIIENSIFANITNFNNYQFIKTITVPALTNDNELSYGVQNTIEPGTKIFPNKLPEGVLNEEEKMIDMGEDWDVFDPEAETGVMLTNLNNFIHLLYSQQLKGDIPDWWKEYYDAVKQDSQNGQFNLDIFNMAIENSISALKISLLGAGDEEISSNEWYDIDFIFNPLNSNYNSIVFQLDRTFDVLAKYPAIIYQEAKVLNNLADKFDRDVFNSFKITSSKNLLMAIDGQEIYTGKTGTYELDNSNLNIKYFSTPKGSQINTDLIKLQIYNFIKDQFNQMNFNEKKNTLISQSIIDNNLYPAILQQDDFIINYSYIEQ